MNTPRPDAADTAAFTAWQADCRRQLGTMLGLPKSRPPLAAESRGSFEHGDLTIEKWVFTSEPGSRVPAVFYRPTVPAEERLPTIVMTFGHGGSKSQPAYSYTAQVFAKLGFNCLCLDPIGEEERHAEGGMGTRAHDPEPVHNQSSAAGRLIMGKLVWDTMRGVDFVLSRDDVDSTRLGVSGNSLGGAKAGWMATLEPRLSFAMISGWSFAAILETYGKFCTRVPNLRLRELLSWADYLSLAAPHCAMRIVNGDADTIIDKHGDGTVWRQLEEVVAEVAKVYAAAGRPQGIQTWYEAGGGHRPYPARTPNLAWLVATARPAACRPEQILPMPEINFGDWCDVHGFPLEKLYGTPLHLRGATVVDLNVAPLRRAQLAVLDDDELGHPDFTIEGWLSVIGRAPQSY